MRKVLTGIGLVTVVGVVVVLVSTVGTTGYFLLTEGSATLPGGALVVSLPGSPTATPTFSPTLTATPASTSRSTSTATVTPTATPTPIPPTPTPDLSYCRMLTRFDRMRPTAAYRQMLTEKGYNLNVGNPYVDFLLGKEANYVIGWVVQALIQEYQGAPIEAPLSYMRRRFGEGNYVSTGQIQQLRSMVPGSCAYVTLNHHASENRALVRAILSVNAGLPGTLGEAQDRVLRKTEERCLNQAPSTANISWFECMSVGY